MPTNTLGAFNPIFYAQEGLILLEKALGLGRRVYLGYDAERRSFNKGDTVSIRRPSTFTAQDAPSSAQNLVTQTVNVSLNQWKEVKFALTDKELAFTGEQIITQHITPAAYALADYIDQTLAALTLEIPWVYAMNSTLAVSDITGIRQKLFDNKVPLSNPNDVHLMLDGSAENGFLQLAAFSQWQGAGQAGADTNLRGTLGTRFGLECFANQNTISYTSGAATTDYTGALTANAAVGDVSIAVGSMQVSVTGAFKKGDIVTITGDSQPYAITADATTDSSGNTTLYITPPIAKASASTTVVTVNLAAGSSGKTQNLAFHSNAFCLVTAPLSTLGDQLGAKIATVQDPRTGLSLRSRLFYDGANSAVNVALDVLFGVKTLNNNLAVRGYR